MTNPVVKYTQATSGITQMTGQSPSGVQLLNDMLTANNYLQVATNGSNKMVWRTKNYYTARPYIRAEDAGTYLKVVTGEGYQDIDTLINLCPTVAQRATGLNITKSDTASSAARNFTAYVSDRGFCLFTVPVSGSRNNKFLYIGEYDSYLPGELGVFNWVVMGSVNANSDPDHLQGNILKSITYPQVYIPRARSLLPGSQVTWITNMDTLVASAGYIGAISTGGTQETDPVSGGLLGPIPTYVTDPIVSGNRHLRGRVYGLWEVPWAPSGASTDPTYPITSANYPGRSWKLFRHLYGTGGNWCIEESNWYAPIICQSL